MHKIIRWIDVKKTHGCCKKNYALYNYGFSSEKQLVFPLHQLIHLIIVCIKVWEYSYQKNSLRGIIYFMSKCARIKFKIS